MNGSDIYILPGSPIMVKVDGKMTAISEERIMPPDAEELIHTIYSLHRDRSMDKLYEIGDDDFSFALRNIGRFRCNAYRQRGTLAAVLRLVTFGLPDPKALHIPETILNLHTKKRGMILVTGPAGSGKSSTLACLIDKINQEIEQRHK